jgi:hypothetical protein
MKIAYLILAHKNPKLLQKSVQILSHPDVSFYIHIDAKFDLEPFAAISDPNIFFIQERIPVFWGEFSQTEAIFLLMQQAFAASVNYDYFILLSGSDFPLKSGQYIRDFLEKNQGCEFITMAKLPTPGMPLSRITTLRFPSTRPVLRFIFRVLAKAGLAQRDYKKFLGNLEPFSGHTWWALTRRACAYIIDFNRQHPELAKFFKNTHASDEILIHTILANSPFKSQIRRHLMFEDWHSPAPHPEMINDHHVDYFVSQNKVSPQDGHGEGELLFARKFSDDSYYLVERVAAMIEKKTKHSLNG